MGKSIRLLMALAAICFTIAAASRTVRADTVTFVTTGTFSNIPESSGCGGSGTNSLTCSDGTTFTFTGTSFSQDVSGTGGFSLGRFTLVFGSAGMPLPNGATLTVRLEHSSPALGIVIITGSIVQDGPFQVLRFTNTTFSIGGISYIALGGLAPQTTDFSVLITAPVPEPTSVLLLASGILGIVGKIRGRRKAGRQD